MVIRRRIVGTSLGPISLCSDEELVSIEPSPLRLPADRLPAAEVLVRLGGGCNGDMVGAAGPLKASLVNPENALNRELRRYEAVFGRDALYAAGFLSEVYPLLEESTVRYLSAFQAEAEDRQRQAEPGKIANHIRSPDDPLAVALSRETGRGWPWYGATDTTVLFVAASARVMRRSPALAMEPVVAPVGHPAAGQYLVRDGRTLRYVDVLGAAVGWLERQLGRDPEAFLVWAGLNDRDSFTVWTDSPNAFSTPSGRLPRPPIAPLQLQAQAYEALRGVAEVADVIDADWLNGPRLEAGAQRLQASVLQHFVVTDSLGPFLATAVERRHNALAPVPSLTVNLGLTLITGIVDGDKLRPLRDSIVRHLFSAAMMSTFGLVGRARTEVRFEPFDYHSQVWAFATHQTARGLRRCGYRALARDLDDRILGQTQHGLLPENVGAADHDVLSYCQHVLRVRRPDAAGRITVTVKERPPAPYAAWTAAAIHAIEAAVPSPVATPTPFERDLLDAVRPRR